MGDLVNLRTARKARARLAREASAAENRVRFGRTKGAKARDRSEAAKAEVTLDRHRREDGDREP